MSFIVLFTFISLTIHTSKSQFLNHKIHHFDKDFSYGNKGTDDRFTYHDYHQHKPTIVEEYHYIPKPTEKVYYEVIPHQHSYDEYSPVKHQEYKGYEPVIQGESLKHSPSNDEYEARNEELLTQGLLKSLKGYRPIKYEDDVKHSSGSDGYGNGDEALLAKGFQDYTPVRNGETLKHIYGSGDYGGENEELLAKNLKEHKKGAIKKFAKLDKHSDNGYNKKDFIAEGGYHDQQKDGKKAFEKSNYEKNGEYSHDKGFGFLKAWGWDRKHIRKDLSGHKTKKLAEISASDKGGHKAIAKHDSSGHHQKAVKAIAGKIGYKKIGREEGAKKIVSNTQSDYDHSYPIYG